MSQGQATEKWSAKEAKKASQKFRREANTIFSEYRNNLMKKLDEMRIIIKPRPRWMPRKVWMWFSNIFVDLNSPNKALVVESPQDFLVRKHKESLGQTSEELAKSMRENGKLPEDELSPE